MPLFCLVCGLRREWWWWWWWWWWCVVMLQVADFARSVLTSCTANDCLPSLHLLGFLQEVRQGRAAAATHACLPAGAMSH